MSTRKERAARIRRCHNCGERNAAHFVPPSFGAAGFWLCSPSVGAARDVPVSSRADDAGGVTLGIEADVSDYVKALDAFMDPPAVKVRRARALGDRLRASSEHRVQECGAFIGEALDGTLDEAALAAFLRGRP